MNLRSDGSETSSLKPKMPSRWRRSPPPILASTASAICAASPAVGGRLRVRDEGEGEVEAADAEAHEEDAQSSF